MEEIQWITASAHMPGFVLQQNTLELIKRSFHAIDRLYALARWHEAESLDHMVEELLEDLENAGAELDTESSDALGTGIEDYELDESADEGYISHSANPQDYWEPDMIVASDSGF